MPDHSDFSDWYKDPKAIVGAFIAVLGGLKAIRYRRKTPEIAPIVTQVDTDRMVQLERRVQDQQRLLMQTREELKEVILSHDALSGEVTQLRLANRADRAEVKDALVGINEEMARVQGQITLTNGRLRQIVRRLDEPQEETPPQ